jgi:hypothetical protein
MLDDMLNIVVDPIFNPHYSKGDMYQSYFSLPASVFGSGHRGYSDKLNLFSQIGMIV